jgi:hypothetical protein
LIDVIDTVIISFLVTFLVSLVSQMGAFSNQICDIFLRYEKTEGERIRIITG